MVRPPSSWPAALVESATTCACCAANWRVWCATCCAAGRSHPIHRPRHCARSGPRPLEGVTAALLARRTCCARSTCWTCGERIKGAAEPRYHLQMALLRWIHLRKLTPLSDLIERLEACGPIPPGPSRTPAATMPTAPALRRAPSGYSSSSPRASMRRPGEPRRQASLPLRRPHRLAQARSNASALCAGGCQQPCGINGMKAPHPLALRRRNRRGVEGRVSGRDQTVARRAAGSSVAQADRIDFEADRVVIAFAAGNSFAANLVVQKDNKTWLRGPGAASGRPQDDRGHRVVNNDSGSRRAAGGVRIARPCRLAMTPTRRPKRWRTRPCRRCSKSSRLRSHR